MDNDVLINFINACNEDLINDKPVLYEAYFLKIYVAFENYLGELFEKYCIGQMSSEGYIPKRRLEFDTLEQLRNIINSGKKQNYIDYIDKIKSISKDIFEENPFDILLEDSENVTIFNQMISIRNCIAHESDYSKKVYQDACLGNSTYKSPGNFLMSKNKRKSKSNYAIYIDKIKSISYGLIKNAE